MGSIMGAERGGSQELGESEEVYVTAFFADCPGGRTFEVSVPIPNVPYLIESVTDGGLARVHEEWHTLEGKPLGNCHQTSYQVQAVPSEV